MGKICFLENICTKYLKNVKEEKTKKKNVFPIKPWKLCTQLL